MRITKKEQHLQHKWGDKNRNLPINVIHHSFDSAEREKRFIARQYADSDQFKKYQSYRDEWYRRPKQFDPGPAPLAVVCELVSSCNLACSMCYTKTEEFQQAVVGSRRMLPWPVVKEIIDECARLNIPSILFSWRGESTLYRWKENNTTYRFADVLAYARRRDILEITSLTNGRLIDNTMAAAIVAAEPTWLSFSIDGLHETYNMIRKRRADSKHQQNGFATVVQAIEEIIRLRRQRGSLRPRIRTNTIYPAIARNPDRYYRFMLDLGVDFMTVNELMDHRYDGGEPQDCLDNWICQYPFQRLTVAANGTILPCPSAHNEEAPLTIGRYRGCAPKDTHHALGVPEPDLDELNLEQAWHHSKMERIRRLHKTGHRKSITPGCLQCRYGIKSKGVTWIPEDWDMDTMTWADRQWRS